MINLDLKRIIAYHQKNPRTRSREASNQKHLNILIGCISFLIIFIISIISYMSIFHYPSPLPRFSLFNLDPNFLSFLTCGILYLLTLKKNYMYFLSISIVIIILTTSRSGFLFLFFITFFELNKNFKFQKFLIILISLLVVKISVSLFLVDKFNIYAADFDVISFIKTYLPMDSSYYNLGYPNKIAYLFHTGPFRIFNFFEISAFYKLHAFGTSLNLIYNDLEMILYPYKYLIYDELLSNSAHEVLTLLMFKNSIFVTVLFFYLLYTLRKIIFFNNLIFASVISGLFLGDQVFSFIHLYLFLLFPLSSNKISNNY